MISTPWLTKEQAAAHLQVTTRTIDRLVKAGKLRKHVLDGTNSVRFKREDLDGLMEPEPEVSAA